MSNLDLLNQRLRHYGGNQEGRMIQDKYRSFLSALKSSYQAADVQKMDKKCCSAKTHKVLINPDKTKMDYDNKILSAGFEHGYKTGDIFHWVNTNTYWLIYLRELTEDAYFRAEIRRCKYKLQWLDEDTKEKHETYAYIRGPVETKVNFIQKGGISADVPNESLEVYIPDNEATRKYFKRYARFIFKEKAWEVQSHDDTSPEGIIQFSAIEHFINPTLDDQEQGLVNAFEFEPVREEDDGIIRGSDMMVPTSSEMYKIETDSVVKWSTKNAKDPVSLQLIGDNSVEVYWDSMVSGNFTLVAEFDGEKHEKNIIVESLF